MVTSLNIQKDFRGRLAVGGILAVALLLRLIGIHFGLPHLYHADEPIVVNHALVYGTGDLNPHFFKIPPLISYLLFLFYGLSYLTGKAFGVFSGMRDFEHLFFADPTLFYLSARVLFGALMGTASVWLLHRLIKKYFSENHALFSALFFAVVFLHVRDSHFIYTDIPLILALIGCFFPILRIAEGSVETRHHFFAGAGVGLSLAVKYNGAMILIPYLVATCVSREREKIVGNLTRSGITAMGVYSVMNPFAWLDFSTFINETAMQAQASGNTGWLHHLVYSLNGGIGPGLLMGGILGMISGFLTFERKRLVFISFVLSYYLLLVLRSQHYDRYALPLIPFFLFLAADFILSVFKKTPSAYRNKIAFFLILLTLAPTLTKSVLCDVLLLRKDVRTLAKEWVEETIPTGSRLALDWSFFQPRLTFSKAQLEAKLNQIESRPYFSKAQKKRIEFLISDPRSTKGYDLYFFSGRPNGTSFLFESPQVPYNINELRRQGIEYVFIVRVQKDHPQSAFYKELKDKAELVKRFSPYRDPKIEYPLDRQPLTGAPFLWKELLARQRNGQPIEVYRLK